MIGDGLNDAPALSNADVGISMGISGSALASETGNIILMTNDIQKIPKIAHLARRVRRKIIENMFLSIITKAAIVALAIAGHPLVWAAVLADTGTCLLVILNSMLLMKGGRRSASSHNHKDKSHNCGTSCKSSSNLEVECKKLDDTKHPCGDHAHGHVHDHDHHHDHHDQHEHEFHHDHDHDHHHDDDDDDYDEGNEYAIIHCDGVMEDKENHSHALDLEVGAAVEFCCQLLEENSSLSDGSNNISKGGCRNRRCSNWKNKRGPSSSLSDVNILKGGCRNRKCSNLKNRSVRACCRDFMKECSASNSRAAGGSLRNNDYSEIVAE